LLAVGQYANFALDADIFKEFLPRDYGEEIGA